MQKFEILNERAFDGYENDKMMNEFEAGRSAGSYTLGSFVPPQFSSTPARMATKLQQKRSKATSDVYSCVFITKCLH